ncbi:MULTISPECIES: molybdenum cofactor guanylyltransferase MobA [Yersinia pseudotuberculosis complex]|uniref:Molybdenum cofactor guanylyltransferase n=2 Tax=Yersinia pseudotuberculosis TaxID=633 RepID=MOBA_YERP3|nr:MULTISPECIES: molybdenum cofactor guanylyltransferase MobA [Yersinia pseudotuberculosis complex]A7FCP0.1 RecName: Full=Molybdenum cofactor guanylyltransferase; Short=MoCo guanylyltransferase; AltName: Full=GTP:molybdopterin guanylyltransferase; AltName: Full=Mo-MPT guanylyltransferase; AltName: Full=Molybdopterin guanylyltransferase; AltName: Full=Molybdopterin-guanine dinucleotide synthase; Short=MGD synthase [Yersinia pseudotuberculosis IP 31758]B1JR17.1 RecName: Full=Molybdenum cofactor gua
MQPNITGVILAGGRSSRMGGNDKGLIPLNGKPLFQYVIDRFKPQVSDLLINANRNQGLYKESGIPVIDDIITGFVGPLAGMHAGLSYASTEWVVFAPCDVPALPSDLVSQLWQGKKQALAAYANDDERAHPTFALMHISLKTQLADYLIRGDRKLMLFLDSINAQRVKFSGKADLFSNLNTPADCDLWEQKRRGQ